MDFDYAAAFSRNLGLVQPEEQDRLRSSRVAIAGLGGVGGVHLTTLARLGVGKFHIADFDHFEVHNINRQAGAFCSTLGRQKSEVMREIATDINPTAEVITFADGVTPATIAAFLSGVDVVVDGLDYFALEARALLYREAEQQGIPVVAAGPIGASAALLTFVPGGMTWHQYFAMDLAQNVTDKYVLFALGTAPKATHMPYLDRRYVNLAAKRGPSLSLAVQLCAGVAAAEVLKLLLKRGTVRAAPVFQQFDAYRGKFVVGRLRWGNRGPIQRIKFALLRRWLASHANS